MSKFEVGDKVFVNGVRKGVGEHYYGTTDPMAVWEELKTKLKLAWAKGEKVQYRPYPAIGDWRDWEEEEYIDLASHRREWRVKPPTVVVNGVEVKRGETISPEIGTTYWIPSFTSTNLRSPLFWEEDETDKTLLDRGIVFLNKEDAMAMTKAMLNFDKP